MHVAVAINNLDSGGAQRQAVSMAIALARRSDVRLSFLVYRDEDFFAESLRGAEIPVTRISKSATVDPFFPRRVARWLEENDVDILHSFLLNPSFWNLLATRSMSRRARPIFIVAERNCMLGQTRKQAWMQRFVFRGCDALTVNAQSVAPAIHETYGVPLSRIAYIPNGLDFAHWDRRCEEPCPIDLDPAYFNVGLVGRIEEQKNHRLLLDAMSRLPAETLARWRVLFVGAESGPSRYADSVRAEIERRGFGEIVRLVPAQRAIAPLIRGLDLLVLPSRFEGFPNVALEAMASGTPVVATRVGDVPNLIEHGVTGFSCESEDAEGLKRTLERADGMSEEERASLVARARRSVEERFTVDAMADRNHALHRSLLEARHARTPVGGRGGSV